MNRVLATVAAGMLLGVGVAACDSEKGGYEKGGDRLGKDSDRPAANDGRSMGGMMRDDAPRTPMGTPMGPGSTAGTPMGQGDTSGMVAGEANKTVSPMSQGNNAADLETTQIIRRALLGVDGLSVSAKNLTIITNDGVVTLRGSVATKVDRDAVVAAANSAAGKNRVDDQIVVNTGNTALNE